MAGRLGNFTRYGGFPVGYNSVGHALHLELEPFGSRAVEAIVGFTVVVDSTDLAEAIVLLKLTGGVGVVDAVGLTAAFFDDGETGDVAGAIGDVDHVLHRDPAVLGRHVRVYVNGRVLIGALVDFEDGFGLGRIVDDHADLGDLGFGGQGHLSLFEETGLQRVFHELACPDAVDFVGDRAAADHFGEAGAHDVVLEHDLVFAVGRFFLDPLSTAIEKVGQAGVEFDIAATFTEDAVTQPRHFTGQNMSEQVVQIGYFTGDMVASLAVVFAEIVGFVPKIGLVDPVATKEGRLHVFRDQRLVEVPYTGDDVLSEKCSSHN